MLGPSGSLAYSGPSATWIASNDDVSIGQDAELPEAPMRVLKPEDFEGDATPRDPLAADKDDVETTKRQKGDLGIWMYYARSIGWVPIIGTMICIAINTFGNNFQKLWLQWNTGKSEPAIGLFLGIYTMFVVITLIFQIGMFG